MPQVYALRKTLFASLISEALLHPRNSILAL